VYLAGRAGTADLAAYQVSIGIFGFLVFGLDSLEAAAHVLVAEAIGARDVALTKATTRRILVLSVYLGLVLGALTALLAGWLPRVFTPDPAVVSIATASLFWVAAMMPVSGVAFAVDGVCVAAGKTRLLMQIMVGCTAVFATCSLAADRLWGPISLGAVTALLGGFMALRALAGDADPSGRLGRKVGSHRSRRRPRSDRPRLGVRVVGSCEIGSCKHSALHSYGTQRRL
jgi:Na+-driven multidrug efflux pump